MIDVILYTKSECRLCEEVKSELAQLSAVYPHKLREIDITQDRDTFARYRYSIPVVHVGQIKLHAPITPDQLKSALATAGSST